MTRLFQVVVNDEDQHSLWPAERDLPTGWRHVWGPDTQDECLLHIEAVWTDITPRSVRERLAKKQMS
ncbi:MAG: MbtH family protein [Actinomycetota bacterium]|nr:MbtH family protein [Actinomycetota bacterium]